MGAGNPQENFDQLYGSQAKKIAPHDAAAFAEQILTDAEKLTDDPTTSAFLVAKAMEFWQKSPNNPEKMRVGEMLLTDLLNIADGQYTDKKYPEAAKSYQQASTIATVIKSPKADDFANRKTIAHLRVDALKKVPDLKADLADKAKASTAARTLVMLLVLEMDDPKSAQTYLDKLTDETVKDMASLAAKELSAIAPDKAKELAEWYRTQVGVSSTDLAGKATAYARAKKCYEKFIAEHGKQDMELLTANKALEEIEQELEKLSLPSAPQEQTPEDSMGTWMVQFAYTPATKTYLSFHKEGKVTITALSPDLGNEHNKNAIVTHASITEDTWETVNHWTLPLPLSPGKITVDWGRNMKQEGVLTKAAKGLPAAELAKFSGRGKSTKIPGKWDCGRAKMEFRDDGTGVMTSNTFGMTNIYLCKWKTEKGQLLFGSSTWETYSFPYPLGKGETKGKKSYTYGGRGYSGQDVTIKPWKEEK
jgi:hypothetical protein